MRNALPTVLVLAQLFTGAATHGQIVVDGTLPDTVFEVLEGPDFEIPASKGHQVQGSLFHSFREFSVPTGGSATFSGQGATGPIDQVLSRITGTDPSLIHGRLASAIANADLYLINPNGIVFGAGATLDLPASFYGTTADLLRFGAELTLYADSAADGALDSVFRMAPIESFGLLDRPRAFEFTSGAPARIAVENAGLAAGDRGSLSLIGGELAVDRARLVAPSGNLDLIAVGSSGEVMLDRASGVDLGSFERLERVLLSGAILDVEPDSATGDSGDVTVRGSDFLLSNSVIFAGTMVFDQPREPVVFSAGSAGGIDVWVSNDITIDRSGIQATSLGNGHTAARGGSVRLHAEGTLQLLPGEPLWASPVDAFLFPFAERGSSIVVGGSAQGGGGEIELSAPHIRLDRGHLGSPGGTPGLVAPSIDIKSSVLEADRGTIVSLNEADHPANSVRLEGTEAVTFSDTTVAAVGAPFVDGRQPAPSGSIYLAGDDLRLTGAVVGGLPFGLGFGSRGEISVEAGRVALEGSSVIGDQTDSLNDSPSFASRPSLAGDIVVSGTEAIVLKGRGSVLGIEATAIRSSGSEQAGNIFLSAPRIEIDNAWIESFPGEFFSGSASPRRISLRGSDLVLSNGGHVSNVGGDIELVATRSLLISGEDGSAFPSGANTSFRAGITAQSGNFRMKGGFLSAGGFIATDPGRIEGAGQAGNLIVSAENIVMESGARMNSGGSGGLIRLEASDSIAVRGEGTEVNTNLESGEALTAGRIELVSPSQLVVSGGAQVVSTATGEGGGGDIELSTRTLRIEGGSLVAAVTEGTGNAGRIELTATDSIEIESSHVASAANGSGDGGDVSIQAERMVRLSDSSITASVAGGSGGNVEIDPVLVLLEDSEILAQARELGGSGGRIAIRADLLLAARGGDWADPRSMLDASAPGGPQFRGLVEVNAPDTDIAGTLTALPVVFTDPASRIEPSCAARRARAGRFTQEGRGGLASSPEALLVAQSAVTRVP